LKGTMLPIAAIATCSVMFPGLAQVQAHKDTMIASTTYVFLS
jgi:hypothetical protein